MALKFRLVSPLNTPQTAKVLWVKMFYKYFLEDPSSAVSVVNLTFAFCNFSFVPVMHQQQTSGNEWGIHCPFRNSDKQLLSLTEEPGYGLLSKATSLPL